MAKLNFTANPNFTPQKPAFGLITPGDYVVQVIESEVKATQSGKALSFTFQVIDDSPFRNRRVWVMLNLQHPDPEVVGRANAELQALCKAVGFAGDLTESSDLHNKPLTARIYETKPKPPYPAKNSANRFRPANWLYPPMPAPAAVTQEMTMVEPPAPQPMSPSDRARALLARMRAEKSRAALDEDPPF